MSNETNRGVCIISLGDEQEGDNDFIIVNSSQQSKESLLAEKMKREEEMLRISSLLPQLEVVKIEQ